MSTTATGFRAFTVALVAGLIASACGASAPTSPASASPSRTAATASSSTTPLGAGTTSPTVPGDTPPASGSNAPSRQDLYRWSAVDVETGRAQFADLTSGPFGFVAVGTETGPEGTGQSGVVWTSSDGRTWTRIEDDELFAGMSLTGVTASPAGLVAVGAVNGETRRAAAWTSIDGTTWTRSDRGDLSASAARGGTIARVTWGPGGFVATGEHDGDPTAWVSEDGQRWTRVAMAGGEQAQVFGVAATAMGYVVVGGGPGPRVAEVGSAAVWTSSDGVLWSRVPSDDPLARAQMWGVTQGADRVVAVGMGQSEDPALFLPIIWHSPDGRRWTRAESIADAEPPTPPAGAERDLRGGYVRSVASGPLGFVAVGGEFGLTQVRGEQRLVLWTSSDGSAWNRVPHAPVFDLGASGALDRFPTAVSITRDGLVVVPGRRGRGKAVGTTVWVGTPTP